ncbi:unnamed protein product [Amoebophrya sp. A120]|nr:unnamed protein product [Amoebophrya sp. A120]|eukprot:GSA120T00021583001.1
MSTKMQRGTGGKSSPVEPTDGTEHGVPSPDLLWYLLGSFTDKVSAALVSAFEGAEKVVLPTWALPTIAILTVLVVFRWRILVGILYGWTWMRRLKRSIFGDPLADRLNKPTAVTLQPEETGLHQLDVKKGTSSASQQQTSAETAGSHGSPGKEKLDLGQKIKAKWKKLIQKDKEG